MKLRKLVCCVLAVVLVLTSLTFAVSAAETDVAETGYYNQNLYETYAKSAVNESSLGSTYTKSATTFKVWAPEAQSVMVRLYTTGTDNESGAATISTTAMTYNKTSGIWSLTLSGDHKDQYYTYIVQRDGTTKETQDPYAHAVGANGDRSMIVDLDSTDPDGWAQDKHVLFDNPGEAVVWEIHVRDFSISASSGVSAENKGKYLAFTEGDTTVNGAGKISTCVDYLVEHNINCVQLMPVEDFASVDETSDAAQFNWGYDPKNYNVPEGSYSTDPYNGNTRITEFKMLVQALHDRGISVVMDVVYNHTFVLEGSPLSLTTPKYYYRMSSATDYYDGTGLGNVLSSEKAMTRKYIQDSLCYWASEYHIDGFRFDLMGCHDLPSLKAWRTALDKIDTRILMYGEPWIGGSNNGITNGLTNANLNQLTRIGAFNQTYSDTLKGDHGAAKAANGGFITGGSNTEVLNGARGTASYFPSAKVNQFINYTDNHDNLIMFDKILAVNKTGIKVGEKDNNLYNTNKNAVNNTSENILNQMKLGLTAALTSQGTPFTVAGTEFCRTKYGEANSYRSPDNMNSIDWNRASTYKEVSDYYAGLVAIRKAFSAFGDSTSDAITTLSGCTAYRINNNKSGQWKSIVVALNNSASAKSVTLPSGTWTVVANGKTAGTTSLGTASGSYSVPKYSGVVLVDSSSFGSYVQPSAGTASLTVEHYTRTSASGSYTKVKTETAKYKEGQTYRASKNLSILFDHNFDKSESTSGTTFGTAKANQNITVKFYYTRYTTSGYLKVNFLNTTTGAKVKTTMKYHMRNGDPFAIPNTLVQGYQLDTTKYPGNTRGTFSASNPPEFNFYYSPLSNKTTIVHYFKDSIISGTPRLYAYYTDDEGQIQEPGGKWTDPKSTTSMQIDTATNKARGETGWYVKTVNAASFYVMFHDDSHQVPGAGEQGYSVSGEAWIKAGIVQFNNTIVTSHIDMKTGKQVSADVTQNNTSVRSDQIYTTKPVTTLNRKYIAPANATGFYQAGVTNVVYLYEDEEVKPTDPPTQPPTTPVEHPTTPTETGIIGDANLSGKIEITDATEIQRHLAEIIQLSAKAKTFADCDGDNKITITDVTLIQRFLADIETTGSKVGEKLGGTPVVDPTEAPAPTQPQGGHTYADFISVYNTLSSEFSQYSASKYGSDPNYVAAQTAISNYGSLVYNPGASEAEIEKAYTDCNAALNGLAALDKGGDDPIGDTMTIYFSNSKGWDTVYAYMWGDNGANGEWPGEEMSYVETNDYGQDIFSVEVDTAAYSGLVFTDNNGSQTEDIFLPPEDNGIYADGDPSEEGKYGYGFYHYGGGDDPYNPDDPPVYDGYVYLEPGVWNVDGARFAAYFFEGDSYTWVNMKFHSDSTYSASIPSGYSQVIFVRMNGATSENVWENKWNQTDDLEINSGQVYTISDWGSDKSPGEWSYLAP